MATVYKVLGQAVPLSATVTAASAAGGTVTYTASNSFVAGALVSISGLSTGAFNLQNVIIATASSTQFTVTNAATGTAVTGATATATSSVSLYTVPAATSCIISTISVANLGTSGTFRIAVRPAGATLADKHYLACDVGLNANDTITWTIGITLATTDIVTIHASNTSFAFTAFGSEIV